MKQQPDQTYLLEFYKDERKGDAKGAIFLDCAQEIVKVCHLSLCMLTHFSCFCCCLLTFFKINFFKKSIRNTIRMSKGLDPDQDRCSDGPDLGSNLFAEVISR